MNDQASPAKTAGYAAFVMVWLALVALTLVLVGLSVTVGGKAAVAAMLLVTPTKASLVFYYFMDLKNESTTLRFMVFAALGVLVIFIGLLFTDFLYR